MSVKKEKSSKTFKTLAKIIPGGVNSPFRSFHEMGRETILFSHGKGSRIWDISGKSYIDYLGAWGPTILGHAHPEILRSAKKGLSFSPVLGLSMPLEKEMAVMVQKAFPSMEMIRFVNSGAEAVESAIRLARGATRRPKIVRFEGGYHGHGDSVLWGYGPEENHSPLECGVPEGLARETLYASFNDQASLLEIFKHYGEEIAALLVEPVTGSMGVIEPKPGFLEFCRKISHDYGAVLIFDEVLTGFRVAFGGAQERYGVQADLTCLGKILGGGLPAGAYGGKAHLMQFVTPLGPVYQAGTFSGNPVTMSAGLAMLKLLNRPNVYAKLEKMTEKLLAGIKKEAERFEVPLQTPHAGSLFSLLFCDTPVSNFRESLRINQKQYAQFFNEMLQKGVLFPPSATDAAVLSLSHTQSDLQQTIEACRLVFKKMQSPKKENR
jgi:glutamate-1-semialdehyde 2,1-aminomutase